MEQFVRDTCAGTCLIISNFHRRLAVRFWELIVWISARVSQCAHPLLLKGAPSTYSQAAFIVDAIYVSTG